MKFFKCHFFAMLFLGISHPEMSLAASGGIRMHATFSEAEHDQRPCDVVFARKDHDVDFHILSHPRGAVIHFMGDDGFFSQTNLVAQRGYDDLYLQTSMKHEDLPGVEFKIHAEGIYSVDLVLLDFSIVAVDKSAPTPTQLCTAKARFFANR
ncbi:MAG: hypothetical protein RIQ81_1633 [Pseudomonadota bacterium]